MNGIPFPSTASRKHRINGLPAGLGIFPERSPPPGGLPLGWWSTGLGRLGQMCKIRFYLDSDHAELSSRENSEVYFEILLKKNRWKLSSRSVELNNIEFTRTIWAQIVRFYMSVAFCSTIITPLELLGCALRFRKVTVFHSTFIHVLVKWLHVHVSIRIFLKSGFGSNTDLARKIRVGQDRRISLRRNILHCLQ